MGTCLSKKKGSSTSSSTIPSQQRDSEKNSVTLTLSKPTQPEQVTLKKQQDPEDESQVKKEIFIIKHRKSHDDRDKSSKIPPCTPQKNQQTVDDANEKQEVSNNKIAPSTPNMGVRTSSCTKEEVDAILIQCGRLSRSSSAKAGGGRKYSGSKRSFDFDHCDNDAVSGNSEENDGVVVASEKGHHQQHQHRSRHRQSPRRRSSPSSQGRRRTPSREREQQQNQQCSNRERRVSRSPGRRSSETTNTTTTTTSNANVASNNNTSCSTRPGKMVSVPATVSSLVMDKSNNCESGTKRISVKRNGGGGGDGSSRSAASPRAQSPARANGNVANAKVLVENQQQQQPSLSRNNSSRKAEQSPYRRNPLSEVDPNILAYPQPNTNNGSTKVQNKSKIEVEANQKPNGRVALEKGVSVDSKTKGKQQEEEIKVLSSVPSGVDNLKPQTLTRSRSSRRSRDLDINPEAVVNPTVSYTSLLIEDIQNFQKNAQQQQQQQPSISLPACLTKACSILEAVADLNSTTTEDRKSPSTQQSNRNEHNIQYAKRGQGSKDPFIESEVVVSDDVMEPSLHKYVTVKRGGSVGGVDIMEDQESSGSNSFTVSSSSQQHQWCISSSSWEPNSADSTDCWTSSLSSEAKKKSLMNNERRECDHEHSSGIGRGRLGSNKACLHSLPVAST